MEIWITILALIGIQIFYFFGKYVLIKRITQKRNQKANDTNNKTNILRIPSAYRITMLVCSIVSFGVSMLAFIIKGEAWQLGLMFFLIVALFMLILFICWSLWRVEIYKDCFIYRNYLGKRKEYKYSELEYRAHPKGLKWYFYKDGKKVFCMPYYIENENKLVKAYRK